MTVAQQFGEAVRHHQAGRLDEAEGIYKKILAIEPRHADSLHLLGVRAHQGGDLQNAARYINQAIGINGKAAAYYSNLGNVLKDQRRLNEALEQYDKAVAADAAFAEAHYNAAIILQYQDRLDAATKRYRQAIAINPQLTAAHNNLGNLLRDLGRFDEAAASLQRAIVLAPQFAEAHYNLATVFKDQDRFDDAVKQYRHVLTLKPDYGEALNNLGVILKDRGQYADALALFNRAIAANPHHAEAHANKGMTLLLTGDYAEGWREYEWRLRLPGMQTSKATPLWDGGDLRGKTILLVCEQGFGDSLQFIRYAPLVKKRGGRVLLSCPQPLAHLFKTVQGIDEIFADGVGVPFHDCHLPLMSLPRIFNTGLDTVPNSIPYLSAPADRLALWAPHFQQEHAGLKVGLVWAGNSRLHDANARAVDRRRSMNLDQLVPLANITDAQFFSLQKNAPSDHAKLPPPGLNLIDLMEHAKDFADTAALINHLDLVIGVDTAVIHLAAAMGKPVWLLSRFDGCWRWLAGREDSPWYPTLRLFRQTVMGDWGSVIECVRGELEKMGVTSKNEG